MTDRLARRRARLRELAVAADDSLMFPEGSDGVFVVGPGIRVEPVISPTPAYNIVWPNGRVGRMMPVAEDTDELTAQELSAVAWEVSPDGSWAWRVQEGTWVEAVRAILAVWAWAAPPAPD